MMSCAAYAAWSRPVSSPCYTEHGQRCGAVMSDCITIVAMYRSGQLGQRYTVKPNCSGLSVRLAGASVTCEHALKTCEPSCVPRAAKSFFILVVHSPLGLWGTWQHRSSLLREIEPGTMGYVAASEPTSAGRQGPKLRNTWQRRNST
jgi:hypothetical protein